MEIKRCQYCSKALARESFRGDHEFNRAKFCDMECYQRLHQLRIQEVCPNCKKGFSRRRLQRKKFCSIKCQYESVRVYGTKYVGQNGYVYVKTHSRRSYPSRGWELEHRLVLEKKLGRKLRRTEVAHHLNGNKQDNRPENIELIQSNSAHVKHHHDERKALGIKAPWSRPAARKKAWRTRKMGLRGSI